MPNETFSVIFKHRDVSTLFIFICFFRDFQFQISFLKKMKNWIFAKFALFQWTREMKNSGNTRLFRFPFWHLTFCSSWTFMIFIIIIENGLGFEHYVKVQICAALNWVKSLVNPIVKVQINQSFTMQKYLLSLDGALCSSPFRLQ